MICYLDSSALVKRYIVNEPGAADLRALAESSEAVITAVITRTEVVAALAKAARTGILSKAGSKEARRQFELDWPDFVRLQITEDTAKQAADVAWRYELRGYDAIQLSSAMQWQNSKQSSLTFAAFDQKLWQAAKDAGLNPYPSDLPKLIQTWNAQK
jgi:predicted nucleic acid-binding protein